MTATGEAWVNDEMIQNSVTAASLICSNRSIESVKHLLLVRMYGPQPQGGRGTCVYKSMCQHILQGVLPSRLHNYSGHTLLPSRGECTPLTHKAPFCPEVESREGVSSTDVR